jgi:probable phosphoglycerate mutase
VLIRHGEAVCNVSGVIGGATGCTGLTEVGQAQAKRLAERLERTGELPGVSALYASVLPRAIETAQAILPSLNRWRDGPPLSLVTDCDLCELHPGEADGLTWDEYLTRFGEPDWRRAPESPFAPGGETLSGFRVRASEAVTEVMRAHPGELVVIVSHAGLVNACMRRFLGIDEAQSHSGQFRTDHASMTAFEFADECWTLTGYNDTAA